MQAQLGGRDAQFVGSDLQQHRRNPLAKFDFAGKDLQVAIGGYAHPVRQ